MGFEVNEISANSKGGTELMRMGLEERLDPTLVDNFQIICSRVRELDETKIRVLWLHDLPGDPESAHLKNGGHDKFHLLVFVSNWQMQQYINYYNIPWSKCLVIENAITPIERENIVKSPDKIKLIYHTTPHRGLEILVPVYEKLCEKHDNLELDVYSSFNIYGWAERDDQYKQLFERCKNNPKINYHGTVSNQEVKKAIAEADIFAYPSIWPETSCISLMEAMSAECVCIHPNYAALYETSAGMTVMYQWHESPNIHANMLFNQLEGVIAQLNRSKDIEGIKIQKSYADLRYNWQRVQMVWTNVLEALLRNFPTTESRKNHGAMFHYKIGS